MEEAEEFVSLMPSLAYLELVARTSIRYLKVITALPVSSHPRQLYNFARPRRRPLGLFETQKKEIHILRYKPRRLTRTIAAQELSSRQYEAHLQGKSPPTSDAFDSFPGQAHADKTSLQDLKQQKFVIEAEPSELVRVSVLAFSTSFSKIGHPCHVIPYSKCILLIVEVIDLRCEGEDREGKGMGGCPAKADLFRFVLQLR
jgi:hypothetical protein